MEKTPQDETVQNETVQNDLDKKTKRRFRLLKQIPTYDIKYEEDKDTAWRRLELLKENLNSFRESVDLKKTRPTEENEGKPEIDLDNDAQYREELKELEQDVQSLPKEEKTKEYGQKVKELNQKIEEICKRYLKKKSMSLDKLKVAVEVKDPEGDLDPALESLKQRNTVYSRPKEEGNHTLTESTNLTLYPSGTPFPEALDDKPTDTVFIKGNNKEGNTHFIAFCNRLYKKKDGEDPKLFLDVDCGYREGACLRYSEKNKMLIICKNKTTIAAINPHKNEHKHLGILFEKEEADNTDLGVINEADENQEQDTQESGQGMVEKQDQKNQQVQQPSAENGNNNQNAEAAGKNKKLEKSSNSEKIELEIEIKSNPKGGRIWDFCLFGENEDYVITVTVCGYVILYKLDYDKKKVRR